MRHFRNQGNEVYIVSATERRNGQETQIYEVDGVHILKVKTLNIQKTHIVEKGLGTLLIERQYKNAIKNHLRNIHFDLILYSTPPITFTKVIQYLKYINPQAVSYLLLKDIFPQNAVDIGMFGKRSLLHWHFRRKEIALYKVSDYIGCMSPANVDFVCQHNPFYPKTHVEVAPNSIELQDFTVDPIYQKKSIRERYGLPANKPIFIYGGNLGRPQGISFLIQCLENNKNRQDCHFVIVGNGTEYKKLATWLNENRGKNVTLIQGLPKEEYDQLVQSCDVGLIFLDHRFTIPNYPSRLLSYLENHMPVLCATDPNTDIGRIAEQNGYGVWCESTDVNSFTTLINRFVSNPQIIHEMGQRGYDFLCRNYLVEHTYDTIMKHLK